MRCMGTQWQPLNMVWCSSSEVSYTHNLLQGAQEKGRRIGRVRRVYVVTSLHKLESSCEVFGWGDGLWVRECRTCTTSQQNQIAFFPGYHGLWRLLMPAWPAGTQQCRFWQAPWSSHQPQCQLHSRINVKWRGWGETQVLISTTRTRTSTQPQKMRAEL